MNRDTLNAALAALIAPLFGDEEAYHPSDICPQGHDNLDPECGGFEHNLGSLCLACVAEEKSRRVRATGTLTLNTRQEIHSAVWKEVHEHGNDPAWHPEWRIPRGEPKDFTDAAVLIPIIKAWVALDGDSHGWSLDVSHSSTDACVWGGQAPNWQQCWRAHFDPMVALAGALRGFLEADPDVH